MNKSQSSKHPSSSRDARLNSARSSHVSDESLSLAKEIEMLKRLLRDSHRELQTLKTRHEQEVSALKQSLDRVRHEVQNMKQEKQESIALQSYGLDEYSELAQEVIRLRTELDRLKYLYDKEKKKNSEVRC